MKYYVYKSYLQWLFGIFYVLLRLYIPIKLLYKLLKFFYVGYIIVLSSIFNVISVLNVVVFKDKSY